MGKYTIQVATGDSLLAGSSNLVQLWLVGEHGEADLGKQLRPLRKGNTELEIDVPVHLGRLLLVKMHKHKGLLDSDWFCKWVTVQGPGTQGEVYFPCYSWVQSNETLCLAEGTALKVNDDTQSLFRKYREQEMEDRRKVYRWGSWKEGLILPIAGNTQWDLPRNQRFMEDKDFDFSLSLAKVLKEFAIKGTLDFVSRVRNLEDYKRTFPCGKTALAERVRDSWREDALFGYQFLNGANPMLLRRSKSLPGRLVLPPEMKDLQSQLEKELQAGSLFEADFSLLDGVKPNIIIFKQQYVAAPLVMLKLEPDGSLSPMLIQLLIPHFRYTMEINILARNNLVSEWGIFDLVVSTGSGGHVDILQRATACLTYRSFCPPDDLADRGLLDVKSSLYAQDALRLWEIISRYVERMVELFYKSDTDVKDDPELQVWCREITEVGLLGGQERGFPLSLESRAQLCRFVTMCIFTCTAQHASNHLGQLDWYAWIPNGPCTMRKPPPTSKDVTEKDIVDALPTLQQARMQMTFTKFLGRRQPVMVALGHHKEEYFSGPEPRAVLKQFQEELAVMDKEIEVRNAGLDLPYEYLRPSVVENSVTI
ncbi:polyunsaturated fatty acid (12S)/(13S)-lipoxygenase, epidermal-type isoform X2 [Peromyscus maniculatus bairdii]|uniref:polyunsaturated fatty acid (12S)/(13S)-lipoxygenase, epidermal-type isoform X2 n=1 Tax=Peromyscus maniculatus bairdii TaxID=230844 RepID=UPI003FD1ECFA